MHTIETLARFRAVLAEYDIVATGLKTVCRGLQRIVDPRAETLFGKLQSLEKHFSLTREPLWQAQVSDENLSLLLATLHAGAAEADPIAPLSQTLHSLKAILSPLANTAECKLQDALPENPAPAAPAAENSRAENLDFMAYSVGFGLPTLASTPYRVILDTTSRCNLRCLTCYQSATQDTIHYDLADSPIETLEPALRQAG